MINFALISLFSMIFVDIYEEKGIKSQVLLSFHGEEDNLNYIYSNMNQNK